MQVVANGTARVLVLDDEEAICALVTCALEPLGYRVTETNDALTAIRTYEEALRAGEPFDLVISDLTIRVEWAARKQCGACAKSIRRPGDRLQWLRWRSDHEPIPRTRLLRHDRQAV
jgi:CheY-like chemotaxis protein